MADFWATIPSFTRKVEQLLTSSLTHVDSDRKLATKCLQQIATYQYDPSKPAAKMYPIVLLKIMQRNDADLSVRQQAAIQFKNTVKHRWFIRNADPEQKRTELLVEIREQIKTHILNVMVSVPKILQAQVGEAVRTIADCELYGESASNWREGPNALLPNLITKLEQAWAGGIARLPIILGLLKMVQAIFTRFEVMEDNNRNRTHLAYTLTLFVGATVENADPDKKHPTPKGETRVKVAPLLMCVRKLKQLAGISIQNGGKHLEQIYIGLDLCYKIFYSLNWLEPPEQITDNLDEWMVGFFGALKAFLEGAKNPVHRFLEDDDDDDTVSLQTKLLTTVIGNAKLYAQKHDEEFEPYFNKFAPLLCQMASKASTKPKHDLLAISAIKFLAAVVVKTSHRTVFAKILIAMVQKIAVPSMFLRESDIDNFKENPEEYIRRDIEGSDTDTRRRVASDLIKALRQQFDAKVSSLCQQQLRMLIGEYDKAKQANWKYKDAAMQLCLAISIKGYTLQRGVSNSMLNSHVKATLIDFLKTQVVPSLRVPPAGSAIELYTITSSAIRFVSMFRQQINVDMLKAILPKLASECLRSQAPIVVHTYAALCIERILVLKQADGQFRTLLGTKLPSGVTLIQIFLKNAFEIVQKHPPNEYIMKCIMRVVSVAGEQLTDAVVKHILQYMKGAILAVVKNPTKPQYNHYLFETISAVVHTVCTRDPAKVSCFDGNQAVGSLFHTFIVILQKNIDDFVPYVLQILAQLISAHGKSKVPLPQFYGANPAGHTHLLKTLPHPDQWRVRQRIPALIMLLEAYILNYGACFSGERIMPILGVFKKLLTDRTGNFGYESYALKLLRSIFLSVGIQSLGQERAGQIFQLLCGKLSKSARKCSPSYPVRFVSFVGFFILNFGGIATLQRALNRIITMDILVKAMWYPLINNPKTTWIDRADYKYATVGTVLLLLQGPAEFRSPIFEALMVLLSNKQMSVEATQAVAIEDVEFASTGTFRKLVFAKTSKKTDKLQALPPIKQYVKAQLSAIPPEMKPAIKAVLARNPKAKITFERFMS